MFLSVSLLGRVAMRILLSCPSCATEAILNLNDDEAEEIKQRILDGGRSPALIAKCTNGHEILVTLYFRNGSFGVRDVALPIRADGTEEKVSEIDWVSKAFGGRT